MFEILDFLFGVPLIIYIVLFGLIFSHYSGYIQLFGVKKIFKNTICKIKEGDSIKTFRTVLGGTVGAGNISGVATAIFIGGPGAVFWMWVVSLISMSTKMTEIVLAVKHQRVDASGQRFGGPMFYMSSIKGRVGKILATIYSVALLMYVVCDSGFVQINTVSTSIENTFHTSKIYIGIILVILSLCVFSKGLKSVSSILNRLVPFMCAIYIILGLVVLLKNFNNLDDTFILIVKSAFSKTSAIGGFTGATIVQAITKGASRGIFANESGTGTSTTVYATSSNKPTQQGCWGILEVAIVSFGVCTLSAFVVISSGAWTSGANGAPMILEAFSSVYGAFGKYLVCALIVVFAYSTYIGFYYEYITCLKYFFKEKHIAVLKWFYIIPIVFAVFLPIQIIWSFADVSVGFAVVPNIFALFLLRNEFKEEIKGLNGE